MVAQGITYEKPENNERAIKAFDEYFVRRYLHFRVSAASRLAGSRFVRGFMMLGTRPVRLGMSILEAVSTFDRNERL